MPNSEILTLVIQKPNSNGDRGRLHGPTADSFKAAGYPFEFPPRSMETYVIGEPGIRILAKGNRYLVSCVGEDSADAAVVGYDRYLDVEPRLNSRVKWDGDLGFAGCTFRLGIDVYEDSPYKSLTDEKGNSRGATLEDVNAFFEALRHPKGEFSSDEYPNAADLNAYLRHYLKSPGNHKEQFIATEHRNALALKVREAGLMLNRNNIREYYNGVEGARKESGLRYPFIADITNSGATMEANDYAPFKKELFVSQAGIVRSVAKWSEEKEAIYEKLKTALLHAQENSTQEDDSSGASRNGHHNIFNRFPFWHSSAASAVHNATSVALMVLAPFLMIGAKRK